MGYVRLVETLDDADGAWSRRGSPLRWLVSGGSSLLHMPTFPDKALAAIGRLTIAVTDLEFLLAWIGADREGGDASKVFTKPGEPLVAARGAVEFAPAAYRDAYLCAVGDAGDLLAQAQATVREMWAESGAHDSAADWVVLQRPTKIQQPVDPASVDDLAVRLMDCCAHLSALVEAHLSGQPPHR